MNFNEMRFNSMTLPHQHISLAHEQHKIIAYEKGDLLFVFNFHASDSQSDYEIGTMWASDHFILFDSDEARFDGHERLNDAHKKWITPVKKETHNRPYTLKLYVPCRTCIVYCTYECAVKKDFEIEEMPEANKNGNHLHAQ